MAKKEHAWRGTRVVRSGFLLRRLWEGWRSVLAVRRRSGTWIS
ncbi:hypothetical protein E1A91_D13G062200v1 [Gossypium mustelinum]|uniref:Uncharacterized protein n=1 Tax=Gossypium mustelinum TaxID=34275 RepID=A0A5D2RZB5_GOSMU|nr:hypothetical protein E1A91_D13G062200v1 [Gossypium mustelinum]